VLLPLFPESSLSQLIPSPLQAFDIQCLNSTNLATFVGRDIILSQTNNYKWKKLQVLGLIRSDKTHRTISAY